MSSLMLCAQCGAPAPRCERCGGAECARLLCAEVHEVSCLAIGTLPPTTQTIAALPAIGATRAPSRRAERDHDRPQEQAIVEQLVTRITQHRQAGRSALVLGDLDRAFDELWLARELEPALDHLGAPARSYIPTDWETETELVPLARALTAHAHPRATDAWRRVLDDGAARSVQAEAAEWLGRDALASNNPRQALRALHVARVLGRGPDAATFQRLYKRADIDPQAAFTLYLSASRLPARSARAAGLRDPLTGEGWADQDARWWLDPNGTTSRAAAIQSDHCLEALNRAADLVRNKRDEGFLLLAQGDHAAGPLGVRSLGRNVRAGCAEAAEHEAFVHIRMTYEAAAQRLPDVAWPWYRLAELMAWAGQAERALELLREAERRGLGTREAERTHRPVLRALVQAGLGGGPDGLATASRPFPLQPYALPLTLRFLRQT